MKIAYLEIQNFRKLKSCRVDVAEKETIFVGANNSGKTSAMDCLISFFRDKKNFTTQDFTLSNWVKINQLGSDWEQYSKEDKADDSDELFTSKQRIYSDGKETSVDRTRRLFYVICSRAMKSLAIVAYTDDMDKVKQTMLDNGWFNESEILLENNFLL